MHTRETQIMNMIIQIPNIVQPINGIPVVMTSADIIRNEEGQQVGHAHQSQRYLIEGDITPEFVAALNVSLAYIGHKLVPIAE